MTASAAKNSINEIYKIMNWNNILVKNKDNELGSIF